MGRFTVIPQDTFNALQLDAGVLLRNFDPENPSVADADIICATTGGINAVCQPTFSDMGEDVDNCPVNMKELMHLDSWLCTLGFTALNISPEGIRLYLGCADVSGNKVTPRMSLKQTDFTPAIWWVGDKANGGYAAIKLLNALSSGGLSIQTTKRGKGQTAVTLTGYVSINAQDVVPMEFYSYDGDDEETIGTLTVSSAAGSTSGTTAVTYTGHTLASGESLKYKVDTAAATVALDDVLTTGWTAWNGTDDITCEAGKKITVAVVETSTNKAKAAGSATTVINTGE